MYDSPNILLKGIKTEFYKQLSTAVVTPVDKMAARIKSSSNKEDYIIPDVFPGIKEFIDSVSLSLTKDYVYTIYDKIWSNGFKVDRFTLADSGMGGSVTMNIKRMVDDFKFFPMKLINTLILANGTAYDASTFFATSHNIDGTNAINNIVSGSGTTLANLITDLASARLALMGFKDKNDEPINKMPDFLAVVPPQLYDTFLKIQGSENLVPSAATESNIYKNSFQIIVNPYSSLSDNDWYLVNMASPIPPFIIQERESPKWNYEDLQKNRYIDYFSIARMNAGYGAFTAIVKVNN